MRDLDIVKSELTSILRSHEMKVLDVIPARFDVVMNSIRGHCPNEKRRHPLKLSVHKTQILAKNYKYIIYSEKISTMYNNISWWQHPIKTGMGEAWHYTTR